jgi:transcriptional regulator with XRE-family HTH domain
MNEAATPEAIFSRRLKETRRARGLSQRRLVARLAALGRPLNQAVITRIERGARKVSLDEAIALAAALDVAPVHLFLPIDDSERVSLTPTLEVSAALARQWARGRRPLDPANTRFYAYQSPHIPDWDEIQLQRQEGLTKDEQAILDEQHRMGQEEDQPPPTSEVGT